MDARKNKLLKKIAGLWKQATKLHKEWAALASKKAPKRKAKPKAKRRRSSR
jgi:hypothetical protein